MPSQPPIRCPQARSSRTTGSSACSPGGFSIVYLAHDENDVPVAIKEYLPSSLACAPRRRARRSSPSRRRIPLRLKCFFEEGRALARFSHPNVVRVLNFFRANETVYMVMRYERGRTLQQHIQQRHGRCRTKTGSARSSPSS